MKNCKVLHNPPFVCAILYKATHIFVLLPVSSVREKKLQGRIYDTAAGRCRPFRSSYELYYEFFF